MQRAQKEQLVTELHRTIGDATMMVVTHYAGLTVAESTDLRRRMRQAGAGYKVTKNRLAKRAVVGTRFEPLASLFVGPTAIAFSKDPVAAAKVAVQYAKENEKLTIVGGAFGDQVLDAEAVKMLASLPSLDELRARLLGLLQAPATRIATVLQAPASQLARVMSAYGKSEAAA
ncbi:MAG: 50S ribosomal protein L10 [Alphaproteobacteria bacterium]